MGKRTFRSQKSKHFVLRIIYECIKSEWKDDFKYWTELCLVLNHKIWQWYERDNQKAVLYDKLWREADEMTSEWSDEKQEYYFQVTD